MYDWTAGASSSISSATGRSVAIFLIGSSLVDSASVDSGLRPASATPAAPDVAVPSTTYRIVLPCACPERNRSANVRRWNSVSTTPGTTCGTASRPPPVPEPGEPEPSSSVPLVSSATAPVLNPDGSRPVSRYRLIASL
jgi:hypothetical protein